MVILTPNLTLQYAPHTPLKQQHLTAPLQINTPNSNLIQQNFKMQQFTLLKSQTVKSICGPFDVQFRRKFLGHRSSSLTSQRNILLKSQSLQGVVATKTSSLLPKLRELEKISKDGSRGMKTTKKEQISDLELYIAKKLINRQSVQDFIYKVQNHALDKLHRNANSNLENATKLTGFSQTQSHFYTPNSEKVLKEEENMGVSSKTAYNTSRKWISDDQFHTKFDEFIVKRPEEEAKVMELFGGDKDNICDSMMEYIEDSKRSLKAIVSKMIESQYDESDEEEQPKPISADHSNKNEQQTKGGKSINWILKKCEDYQRKFKIRKNIKIHKKP